MIQVNFLPWFNSMRTFFLMEMQMSPAFASFERKINVLSLKLKIKLKSDSDSDSQHNFCEVKSLKCWIYFIVKWLNCCKSWTFCLSEIQLSRLLFFLYTVIILGEGQHTTTTFSFQKVVHNSRHFAILTTLNSACNSLSECQLLYIRSNVSQRHSNMSKNESLPIYLCKKLQRIGWHLASTTCAREVLRAIIWKIILQIKLNLMKIQFLNFFFYKF